jgi:hypothetical protein
VRTLRNFAVIAEVPCFFALRGLTLAQLFAKHSGLAPQPPIFYIQQGIPT